MSPEGWGRRACEAYAEYAADAIVAEINFGGAMVESVIRASNRSVNVKVVTASRGKVARAEPISALYEQGRVRHVGSLAPLEDEMCNMTPSGFLGNGSPDRMDACVWSLTELMLDESGYTWGNL
jgi:phage terminase large subunit-like protein